MDGFEIFLKRRKQQDLLMSWRGKKASVMMPRFSTEQLSGWCCHLQRWGRIQGGVGGQLLSSTQILKERLSMMPFLFVFHFPNLDSTWERDFIVIYLTHTPSVLTV